MVEVVSVLDSILSEHGEVISLALGQGLCVHDPHSIFWIESGRVDLFAIQLYQEVASTLIKIREIEGKRYYLSTFESKDILLAFSDQSIADCHLFAVANVDTVIRKIPRHVVSKITQDSLVREEFDLRLGDYFLHFSNLLTTSPPENSHQVEQLDHVLHYSEGEILTISRTIYLQLKSGFLWLKVHEGTFALFEQDWLRLNAESGYYPCFHQSWLKCLSNAKVEAFDNSSIDYSEAALWNGLQLFNQHVVELLVNQTEQITLKQVNKAKLKVEINDSNFKSAKKELNTVLSGKETLRSEVTHDLLFDTCQTIGDTIELKFNPLPMHKAPKNPEHYIYELCLQSNVFYREINLIGDWWKYDSGPLLAFYADTYQPVALIPRDRKYYLVDRAKGTTTELNSEINNQLLRYGFMFYRNFPMKNRISGSDLLKFSAFKSTRSFLSILLFGLLIGCLNLFYPFFNNIIFEYVIPHSDHTLLIQVITGMLVIAISTQLFVIGRDYTVLKLEALNDHNLELGIWQRLLNLPIKFFRRYDLGDMIIRVFSINTIRKSLSGNVMRAFFNSFFAVLYLIPMFYYCFPLAIVGTIVVCVASLLNMWCVYADLKYAGPILEARGKVNGFVLQQLAAISKIRTAGAEKLSFVKWEKLFFPMKKLEWKTQKINIVSRMVNFAISSLSPFVIFAAALYIIQGHTSAITIGDFLAFLAAFTPFTLAVSDFSNILVELAPLFILWGRGKAILEEPLEIDQNKTDPEQLSGDVQLDHISFRYDPTTPLTLDNVSIHAKSGEFIAIIGPSGCGKSSLVKLLIGFEAPESGAIYYDGKELSTLDIGKVRRQLGIVLQSGTLLDGTIRENLTSKGFYSDEEIFRALKLSGFDDDLKRLPMGLSTILMEGGNTLSGGQKQRLLVARALITKPKVLIMDEATSALDNKTQDIVTRNLMQMNVTRIVIAHRLSTIRYADRIYVLEKGKIVDVGTYDELSKRKGIFADFLKFQNPSFKEV